MLIKSADDKTKRLALLEDLQASPLLDRRQRDWLRDELANTRRGIAGERDAAHYLDNYLKDDPDRMLLHDLRFKVDGEVVQIDHMLITRSLTFYLIETKNFNGNPRINEHGEFSVEYVGHRLFGIPSPLEQSRRHEGPLRKLFETLEIQGRAGSAATIEHCVLVSPSSIIHRPTPKVFDTTNVIKADQFRAWHEKYQERLSSGALLKSALNMRSAATVREIAMKLVRQHRPKDLLELPQFLKPRDAAPGTQSPRRPAESAPVPDRQAVTAGASAAAVQPPVDGLQVTAAPAQMQAGPKTEGRKLVCVTCGGKISFPEGRFCWNNERRFGGLQYCREHQAAFA